MTPNRLMRLSITTFVTILLVLVGVLYFTWDADRTQECTQKGYSAAYCGWR